MSDSDGLSYTHTTIEYVEPRIFNSDGAQMEGPLVEILGHEYAKQNELLCFTMHMEGQIEIEPVQEIEVELEV